MRENFEVFRVGLEKKRDMYTALQFGIKYEYENTPVTLSFVENWLSSVAH